MLIAVKLDPNGGRREVASRAGAVRFARDHTLNSVTFFEGILALPQEMAPQEAALTHL